MYRLGKWLYALGRHNEREKLKADLYYFLGWQPLRNVDDKTGMTESEEHYQKRIDAWFAAREIINQFFLDEKVREDRKRDKQ